LHSLPHQHCNDHYARLNCGRLWIRIWVASNHRYFKIDIWYFSAWHATLASKIKYWLAWNQDNMFELSGRHHHLFSMLFVLAMK